MQRANVDRYPPVIHQLRMLASTSNIRVLDRANQEDEKRGGLPEDVSESEFAFAPGMMAPSLHRGA